MSQNETATVAAYLRLKIRHSKIVTITSRHRLTEELRGQAIGKLQVGQNQIEVARWQNRDHGTRFHPRHIDERDAYGSGSICVWGGISLGELTDPHVFSRENVNAHTCRDDILDANVLPYAGAIGDAFVLQDDNIIIDNSQARGVVFDFEGQTREVRAIREVILSAGTVNTAQLLMLSGVGPRRELQKHKEPVRRSFTWFFVSSRNQSQIPYAGGGLSCSGRFYPN
ncbi:transposable element Tcb2 transposase [Trichonephila clavipes]|nr:transposable element Tcb2 transposase [Trichonephila clavipes]